MIQLRAMGQVKRITDGIDGGQIMKKTFRFFFAAVAAIVFASCADKMGNDINAPESDASVQDGNLVQMTFSASMAEDVDSKTTYSARKVYWEASDAITVFSVGENVTKTSFSEPELLENGAVARFSSVADASAETYYAVYPDSEDNTYDNGTFSVVFPHTHVAVADGFPSGSNVSVAVSVNDAEATGQNLQFMNVGALLAFSFADLETAWNTASVAFKAKRSDTEYWRLAGATTLTLDENDLPVAAEGDVQAVVVNAPDGGFKTGVTYYIPVIPVGACKGMELVYTDLNGDTYTKNNDVDFELLRSYMFNVGKLPKPYNVDFLDKFTVSLDFINDWPFVEPCLEVANQSTEDTYTYKYTYDLPDGKKWTKGVKFVLESSEGYSYSHSNSTGLKGGSSMKTFRIKISGISGRYFLTLAFTAPSSNSGKWNLGDANGESGDHITSAASGYPSYEWRFPFTNMNSSIVEVGMGKPCSMLMRFANGRIYTLTITYTTTKPVAQ